MLNDDKKIKKEFARRARFINEPIPEPPKPPEFFVFNENMANRNAVPKVQEEPVNIKQEFAMPQMKKARIAEGGEVLDTLGIEIEGLGISQAEARNLLMMLPANIGNYFSIHHDASVELNTKYIPIKNRRGQQINVNIHTPAAEKLLGRNNLHTSGYELVSIPMYTDTMELSLNVLLPELEKYGDFISNRCATHIHVGMAKNLQMMKNFLKLGLWADELFYSLAGMGGQFRGNSNNAIYARPLMNGPYIKYGDSYVQSLNYEKAFEADNVSKFFAAYGVNYRGEAGKYVPARYFGINIYSIVLHGTLEFRHFNQSFNPVLVSSIAKLCQIFAELGMRVKWNSIRTLEPGNVFNKESPSYYIDKLHRLLYLARTNQCNYELNPESIRELERIIMTYKGIGIENIPILTHLNNPPDISMEIISAGDLLVTGKKPAPAGNIDIHNIRYQSIME